MAQKTRTAFMVMLGLFLGTVCSSRAMASFSSLTCASSDGKITHSFKLAWNMPEPEEKWVIQGKEFTPADVTQTSLSPQTELESWNNQMTGGRYYSEKVELKYKVNGQEQSVKDWLLCRQAGGI